jgi:iron complex outermembrane receptor protein
MKNTNKTLMCIAVSLALTPVSANAQILEEIIVTAQKRVEALQDVPIAIAAFSGDFIKEAKITDIKKLVAYTPGLSGQSPDSFIESLSVRGISTNAFGIGGDSSIGIYKDGVYYGRNGAAVTSFFDIERVEVLKGPQGLLFGRNAASGAVHTITEKPKLDEVEGYIRLGAGERGRKQAEFAYNQPLGKGWAARLSGIHSEQDGFVENLFNGDDLGEHDREALRLSIRNESDWGDVTLMAEHEDRKQDGVIFIGQDENGKSFTGDDRTANLDFPDKDDARVTGVTLTANIDLNDKMTLTSITGYNKHDLTYQEDYDGTPDGLAGYVQVQSGEYYSQEVRLNVDAGGDLKWYVGASVYEEDVSALLSNEVGYAPAFFGPVLAPLYAGLFESNETQGEYNGWAAYVDMTYQLTEKLDVSVGARYTYDEKEAETDIQGVGFIWPVITPIPVKSKQDWDDVSSRIALRYFVDEDMMLFGSVSEGYKAGGLGTDTVSSVAGGIALPDAELDDFAPENILSYEVGAKGNLAGGRVKYGVSAYYYNYEDLQTVIIEVGKALVENIGDVDGMGVELDLGVAINDNWDVFIAAAWSDTDISDIPLETCTDPSGSNCDGNRLAYNPEWTFSGGINANYPLDGGEVFAGLDFSWQDEFYSNMENSDRGTVDSAAFVNLRAGWNSEQNWSVSVYVENIFDEENFARRGGRGEEAGLATNSSPMQERLAGVDINYSF